MGYTDPAVRANMDQLAAYARDAFDLLDVDLHDPAQVKAIHACWQIIASNQHATPWVLAAIAQAVPESTTRF